MNEAKRRLVLAWCAKAENDLLTARLLIEQEQRLLDAGVYHCQQSGEKILKAWLTLDDIVFPKTHDLETLVHLCRNRYPEFSTYAEHARLLTPLATEFRYPGDFNEPSLERARQALHLATELHGHCREYIEKRLAGPDRASD